ncbi:MAG: 4-(cytidine 5'-diphospho)-2-C-methyl-D-erythritol kinase [Coriobacteriales bacterium]|jgi:4-diphosphocytidyl-2-C-methyl-D-erythritol kinase
MREGASGVSPRSAGRGLETTPRAVARTVAPAKVNLYLGVRAGRDGRGYHRVDSLMCALELHDDVEVEFADDAGIELACDASPTPDPRSNLAFRAAESLLAAWGVEQGLRIRLVKRVPSQAGLGGGSSDAAAVLRCLCALRDKVGGARSRGAGAEGRGDAASADPTAFEVARSLGADVPFFLGDRPCMLGGLGDEPRRRYGHLALPVTLARPDGGVPTPAAYRAFDSDPVPPADPVALMSALDRGDARGVIAGASNNLTRAACSVQPLVADTLSLLRSLALPGEGVLLCGSGSACALFARDEARAARVAEACRAAGLWSCATATVGSDWARPEVSVA